MKKILFLDKTISNGYFIDNRNNENIGNNLKMYYTISDDNNIYYEFPIIEPFDRYSVCIGNNQIPLFDYLLDNDEFSSNCDYLIISTNLKILGVFCYPINICENYFSIKVNKKIIEFISDVGYNNVDIIDNVFDLTLLNLSTVSNLEGNEILMFLTSNDKYIRQVLNDMRYKHIKNNIENVVYNKVRLGITKLIDGSIYNFTYSELDKIELMKSKENNFNSLINNHMQYAFEQSEIKDIYNELITNEYKYTKYKSVYLKYLKSIFKNDRYEKKLTTSKINFLKFGYVNETIKKGMNKYGIIL